MYSSISNHLLNFSHFLLAFFIVYIICPRFLFIEERFNLDNVVANFMKMTFLTILVGYLLAFLKLFEFLSIAIIFILSTSYTFTYGKYRHIGSEKRMKISTYIFNYLDGTIFIKRDLMNYFKNKKNKSTGDFKVVKHKKILVVEIILLCLILLYSAYLRFFDAYHFAAPGMSDGSVTLAWMKYIIQRVIFHDGIYPQGFHIYLATLQKIAFIDSIYILKYSGPFNGVLITFGIYFFISRVTKAKAPALVGAIIYGILASYLSIDWIRQAASNSQEFGYVFIFPTLCFTYKYLMHKDKKDLINAFSGLCISGLVHPIAYAFNVLGIALIGVLACILHLKRNFKIVWKVFLSGVISAIILITPLGLGLLFGKEFHGSSVEFLTDKIIVVSPQMKTTDFIALYSLTLLLIYLVFRAKTIRECFIEIYILLLCTVAFLFYYYGGVVTQNAVIATRFSDLWGLTCPVAISYGFYVLLKLIKPLPKRFFIGSVFSGVLLLACLFYIKPEPIITNKMERNEEVEQYLKISSICNPTQWAIVSDTEGAYSQILGRGTHIRTDDFLRKYEPSIKHIYYEGSEYKIPDIFIYYDKKPFNFGKTENLTQRLIDSTKRRDAANIDLGKWLSEYKKTHENLVVFYEDENFMIYRIQQEITQDETLKKIFNE